MKKMSFRRFCSSESVAFVDETWDLRVRAFGSCKDSFNDKMRRSSSLWRTSIFCVWTERFCPCSGFLKTLKKNVEFVSQFENSRRIWVKLIYFVVYLLRDAGCLTGDVALSTSLLCCCCSCLIGDVARLVFVDGADFNLDLFSSSLIICAVRCFSWLSRICCCSKHRKGIFFNLIDVEWESKG